MMFLPTPEGGADIYEIDASVHTKLPKWNLTSDNPPLSIKSALSIARKQLSSQEQKAGMRFASMRLSSSNFVGQPPVWYYSVTLKNNSKNLGDEFAERTLNILMNGDVIQPKTLSKEAYEEWLVKSLFIAN